MSHHQDWEPVVIRGKSAPREHIPRKPHVQITKEQKLEREEIGTHKKVNMTTAKIIQKARVVRGYNTQRELAMAIGVTPGIINSYESGKAIPDSNTMQKLRRVLNVKL